MFAIVPTVGFRPGNVGATPNSLTLSTLAFSDDGNGVPDALTATYEYTGADNLELVAVTSTATTPPGADAAAQKTNIIDGTGTGNLEEFVVDLSDSATAITGLTSTSESATRIHGFLREKTNGATSDIVTVTVTGLDFTVGTFSSAATTSSTGVEVTFSELQYGTPDVTHATVKVGGTAVTVSGASIVAGKLQLTLGSALAGGETLLASYTNADGELSDKDGNALTAFTDQSVTNNVSAGGLSYVGYKAFGVQSSTRTFDISTLDAIGSAAGTGDGGTITEGDVVLVFYGHTNSSSQTHAVSTAGFSAIIAAQYYNGTPAVKVGLYGKEMGATPDTSIEVSSFGTNDATIEIFFVVLRGVDFATIAGSVVSGLTPPAQTPTKTGSVIFAAGWRGSNQTNETVAVGANMTSIAAVATDGNNRDGAGALGYFEWSSGTFTPDAFTSSGGAASAALSVIVEPA